MVVEGMAKSGGLELESPCRFSRAAADIGSTANRSWGMMRHVQLTDTFTVARHNTVGPLCDAA